MQDRLRWSPDGKRAAVIAEDGLRFCDAQGNLSGLLLANIVDLAWFSDSRQFVLVKTEQIPDWRAAEPLLKPERAAAIVAEANALWPIIEKSKPAEIPWSNRDESALIGLYLWSQHADFLQKAYGQKGREASEATRYELILARVEGNEITLGKVLHAGVEPVESLRVRRDDGALAFATAKRGRKVPSRLLAARMGADPTVVAEGTLNECDWTPDGRGLVYARRPPEEFGEEVGLGVICRRRIFDDRGLLDVLGKEEELAGILFTGQTQVRCLRDGRILFNAAEVTLPATLHDVGSLQEGLFVIDAGRQATLTRLIPRGAEKDLPDNLHLFRLSPDESQVAIADRSAVRLLTLATGEVEKIQEAGEYGMDAVPAWRPTGELTYARRNPLAEGKVPVRKAEIVLRKAGQETVLSQSWPDALLERVFPPQQTEH
jgi:hypothetical protein